MECNKEEAIRAKNIAENKMLNKDFFVARKILLKAQQLYPDLENLSQMLTVCEVHCSAEVKVNGEIDWYGILQVVPTTDELTIKKQYRKLALLLHPDKNKFGGAEAAFKLVGEANRTLTDRSKRTMHDLKRGASSRMVPIRQPAPHVNRAANTKKQPGAAGNFAHGTSAQSNGADPIFGGKTFWTMCTSCGIKYQHYLHILNRVLSCQNCKKSFVAYDLNGHGRPSAAQVPASCYTGQNSNIGNHSNTGSHANVRGRSAPAQPQSTSGFKAEFVDVSNNDMKENVGVEREGGLASDVKFEKVNLPEMNKKEKAVKPSAANRRQKRGRKIAVESSDSESMDSDVVIEDSCPSGQNIGLNGSYPRRSARQKQNISYSEGKGDDDDDDDFEIPIHKKSRTGSSSVNSEQNDQKFWRDKEQGLDAKVSSDNYSPEVSPDLDSFTYPDPEFYDFGQERDESEFAADQIWAIYDTMDAMPRYYALIRQVYGPKFKLRFNWLEYDPTSKAENLWFKSGLPIGCGSFKLGRSEQTDQRLMFSHLMPWKKGIKRNTYDIFPSKGEVWALFKNWDIGWGSCVDTNRRYEYELVEIISDFTVGNVIGVARLVMIQGFVSLFVQAVDEGSNPRQIQMKDILQFSHKISSYRLKGNEREGIPKGSLELDSASLPLNFADMFATISPEILMAKAGGLNGVYDGGHSKPYGKEIPACSGSRLNGAAVNEVRRNQDISCNKGNGTSEETYSSAVGGSHNHVESVQEISKQKVGGRENKVAQHTKTSKDPMHHTNSQQPPRSPPSFVYPNSEFHNFEEERSADMFQEGQVWALYSEIDKNPNYYGQITKVEYENFVLHVAWLEAFSQKEQEQQWIYRQLPVGCGYFKIIQQVCAFDTTDTFSHLVQANPTAKKNHFSIYPHQGEVWAVYKNWSLGWSLSDVENCGFDAVEIISVGSTGFKVMVLSKVNGYSCVFKKVVPVITMDITFAEHLRFSHKIPAFRLTEERGGKLRGCWELDPASVPDVLLFGNDS